MDNCIRCGRAPAAGRKDFCIPCAQEVRHELARGMTQLERYLAGWAAFDVWLRDRGGDGGTATFLPHGYSILSGALADGSLASLQGFPGRLALVASRNDGRYVAELVTYVSIGSLRQAALRGMAVEVEGQVTAPDVGMTLSLYNWRTKRWNRLKAVRSACEGDGLLVWLTRRSACDFVSPTGDLCLGMRAERTRAFRTQTGVVRVTVEM
jgi:hypothetical protein